MSSEARSSFQQFNSSTDTWIIYNEQLQQYFKANGTKEENRVATLLSNIPRETYKLLRDLCHPLLPSVKKYEELSELLAQQFYPKTSVWRERRKFHQAQQNRDETVAEWYARVRGLSINCKFGENLTLFLKEKFITGMKKGPILDKVCEEDEKTDLKTLVEVAIKKENDKSSREQEDINFMKRKAWNTKSKDRGNPVQNSRQGNFRENRQYADASGRNGSII